MKNVPRSLNCDILCPDGDAPELPPLPPGRDAILHSTKVNTSATRLWPGTDTNNLSPSLVPLLILSSK